MFLTSSPTTIEDPFRNMLGETSFWLPGIQKLNADWAECPRLNGSQSEHAIGLRSTASHQVHLTGSSVFKFAKRVGSMSEAKRQSPVIWRCSRCGALVHPSDDRAPAAWCSRCGQVTQAHRDGG